jgi:hypothetical protein
MIPSDRAAGQAEIVPQLNMFVEALKIGASLDCGEFTAGNTGHWPVAAVPSPNSGPQARSRADLSARLETVLDLLGAVQPLDDEQPGAQQYEANDHGEQVRRHPIGVLGILVIMRAMLDVLAALHQMPSATSAQRNLARLAPT